jgi:uncharacterized membrane protein
MSNNIKNTAFADSAINLDSAFTELEELSGQIERLDIESDSGLERAKQLLGKFAEAGQRIGDGVQVLAKSLEDSRSRAEAAAQIVSARAGDIQKRQEENDQMLSRFGALGESVKKISEKIIQFKKPAGEKLSEDERDALTKQLPELDSQLSGLIDEAQGLRVDAQQLKLKSVERNADSLSQTLLSARRKLSSFT